MYQQIHKLLISINFRYVQLFCLLTVSIKLYKPVSLQIKPLTLNPRMIKKATPGLHLYLRGSCVPQLWFAHTDIE